MSKKRCVDCMDDISIDRLQMESLDCPECEDGPLCKRCFHDHLFFHQTGFEMVQ